MIWCIKTYIIAYVKIQKKMKIYYPLCQTYSPTVVSKSISKWWTNMQKASGLSTTPNATRTISYKAWNSPAEYPSWVARCDIKGSDGNVGNRPRHWPFCREFTGDRWIPPHKWPVTQNMFPFHDVIMITHLKTITWCRHDMVTPSVLLTICERNPPVTSRRYRNAEFWCFCAVGLNNLLDKHASWCGFELLWRTRDLTMKTYIISQEISICFMICCVLLWIGTFMITLMWGNLGNLTIDIVQVKQLWGAWVNYELMI